MRITPFAVWCQNLSPDDLYEAVKYQTMFTHSNERAIMSCYLYCFAIQELIKNGDPKDAFNKTFEEAKKRKAESKESFV